MKHDDALPARFTLAEVAAFLDGSSTLDGVAFGERHPTEPGAYWWRKHLSAALAARGEPVAKVRVHRAGGNAGIAWSAVAVTDGESLPLMPDGALLYAAPPAPEREGE